MTAIATLICEQCEHGQHDEPCEELVTRKYGADWGELSFDADDVPCNCECPFGYDPFEEDGDD